ncbi:hypothetical protein [Dickeya solani]|uniref:MFS transporter n=1 Tax=Dickeya solani TaxID=1089444 RepID=A0ABU4EJ98_9GAMM|nr:hypothetical protein [Dickeya solani]MCA7000933.1 hypothetical protein [Dickeya solani]MCZ0821725.1 hypothetical protein [Dickeya solani]MDV6994904.1 hypothetical protein [Dickeya solani]MDV7006325.1 hypothetical protein [Dickeya solani]MDV7036938.1 hypothetical protein [Dickeya solani]
MHRRRNSVLLVTVLFIGDALLQVPLGWVSDTLGVGEGLSAGAVVSGGQCASGRADGPEMAE